MPNVEKFIVGNWKECGSYSEGLIFLDKLAVRLRQIDLSRKKVILCPPFPFLPVFKEKIRSEALPLELGGQDVSRFAGGAFTGEVSADLLRTFVGFCLVGHSERRRNFGEDAAVVNRKIERCWSSGITPIICVSRKEEVAALGLPGGLTEVFVAFEPSAFIGGEEVADRRQDLDFYRFVVSSFPDVALHFIYGGSVNEKNVRQVTAVSQISGVLIGHTSLNAEKFAEIVERS